MSSPARYPTPEAADAWFAARGWQAFGFQS